MSIIGRAFAFARERQLGKRVFDALLAPGRFEPQRTRVNANGSETIVSPEIVEPMGILRSRTVQTTIVAMAFSVLNALNIDVGDLTAEELDGWLSQGAAIFAVLAGWFRVKATMPTRG